MKQREYETNLYKKLKSESKEGKYSEGKNLRSHNYAYSN
ncbi:hypothetical protein CP04DC42_0923 [Chlamydia psittaci 04DC42]|uniref:Uncharacterized protein n=1 Tax=Chlamydia psittaci 99DC5 TaxID=1112251 RepID=A0ABP2X2C9_CHLPS|nr:hypothetical protein B595_0551 [Chlamydia psittaci 84/55]AFS22710.1 hypothetical protein B600_0551 [Chlamydia psittaci VS225]AFS25652.1 hypothetical protein B603_0525 [Chlamydia psittaci WC]AFS28037.1 hypothetical protein B712_0519 [Chlamydia psittaci NJ1]EPJ13203.1 hypothetical protein CP02DC16_0931 [Chlamydia psittaci 02DC16]EPJ14942.1 hypothetical protein CP02DC15_0217 [Chlamydia psittaci 02DC15]EPJ15566.1 hypothetical protein CP02DC18_0937 [Chlamydia psittaci 02DC18]EPJ20167.1 hypothe